LAKTIEQINQKIKKGEVVVVTAEEVISITRDVGIHEAVNKIDVVTTGTFSPMCGSGAFLNFGHPKPRIKFGGGKVYLNDVLAYAGIAAVDVFLGATSLPDDDPRNKTYPGEFNYGGGHVIHDLVSGKDIRLVASAYGTDCYPRKSLETLVNINDMNDAILFNIRNAYQNYDVAVNLSDKVRYTYMGILKPNLGNANYCSAGQLSPLLNDPYFEAIGVGTKIFLGGGTGLIAWHGTQHDPHTLRGTSGVPSRPAGTLAVIGDLKNMRPEWLVGTSMLGYGATLTVGVGVPIPILSEEILCHTLVTDADILTPVVDYSEVYPQRGESILGEVSYAELKTGHIRFGEKLIPTSSLSSYPKALEIAETLKLWIQKGIFTLTEPVAKLPGVWSNKVVEPLKERPIS